MTMGIHPSWYKLTRMSELTEYLQSIPSYELTKRVASEISEQDLPRNPRRTVIESFILLTKNFLADFFEEVKLDLERHAYNYPFLQARIPFITYESTEGRADYQRIQSVFRKLPRVGIRFSPKKIQNPVVPIILPGVDYSAESLVDSLSLAGEMLPDKSRLGWQHLDAYADYCLNVMALGRETYASLIDAWYFGNDSDSYFVGLETLAEEMLHHISDEIAGPRYSEGAIDREHYWMKSYGDFPEKMDISLLRLKDEYLGRLRESVNRDSSESRKKA